MTTVIGVYREADEFEAVARDLVAHGVAETDIRVGANEDHLQSIFAEREAEVSERWGSAGLDTFLTAGTLDQLQKNTADPRRQG